MFGDPGVLRALVLLDEELFLVPLSRRNRCLSYCSQPVSLVISSSVQGLIWHVAREPAVSNLGGACTDAQHLRTHAPRLLHVIEIASALGLSSRGLFRLLLELQRATPWWVEREFCARQGCLLTQFATLGQCCLSLPDPQRSPFRCFGSQGYETTLPRNSTPSKQPRYSTDALPPLQASHPKKRGRASLQDPDSGTLNLDRTEEEALSDLGKLRVVGGESEAPLRRQSAEIAGQVSANHQAQKRLSLPSPGQETSASNNKHQLAVPTGDGKSPVKVKRKAPPPVTASVIQSAGGREVVARTGPVPSRFLSSDVKNIGTGGTGSARAQLKDLFSPSELDALSAASNGLRASTLETREDGTSGEGMYETDTSKAFKGALRDIEEALKREVSDGSFGAGQ